jgi:hypothetical protein
VLTSAFGQNVVLQPATGGSVFSSALINASAGVQLNGTLLNEALLNQLIAAQASIANLTAAVAQLQASVAFLDSRVISPPPPLPSSPPPLILSCAAQNSYQVCSALSDLFMAIGPSSSMWSGSSGWVQAYNGVATDYCTFSGLGCSPSGQLTLLEANWINSGGNYGTSYANGTLPASLGTLTSLTHLRIANTQGFPFSGTIPAAYGSLTNLVFLQLNDMSLNGTIPAVLGNLTMLTSLHLHDNYLTGSIPPSFGNLGNLSDLLLNGNQLCGAIPTSLTSICQQSGRNCAFFSSGTSYPACV